MEILSDTSPMPNGKHQGKDMADVPADYLLWCYENDKLRDDVRKYVNSNYDLLIEESKNGGKL